MSSIPSDLLIERLMYLGQISSTETALFHTKAAATVGLGVTDMKTMSVLLLEGPMTAGQVAKRLSLTSGAVTNLFDRLQKREFIERVRDPHDRRKVVVKVNAHALATNPNPYSSMGEAYVKLLATYTSEQLEFLIAYHEQQVEITKQQIAQLAQ